MRESVTYDGVEYAPGRKFLVVRSVRLVGMKAVAPYCWQGWSRVMHPGYILTCQGFGPGPGSDPGYGVFFTSDLSDAEHVGGCEVEPSVGGMWASRPEPGVLLPIGADGMTDDERDAMERQS